MADRITCPGCRRLLQVPEAQRGREVQCPSCQQVFVSELPTGITELPNAPVRPNPVAVQAGPPIAPTADVTPPRRRRYVQDEDDYDMRIDARSRTDFTPSAGLALAVKVLLGLNAALGFVMLASNYLQYDLLARLTKGEVIAAAQLDGNDLRQQLLGVVYLVLYWSTAVVFLVWFYRAHANLTAIGVGHLNYTSGWAVGFWFVPFLNLVRPVQIAQEIWRGSDPDAVGDHDIDTSQSRNSALISSRLTLAAKTPQALLSSTGLSMVDDAVLIIAALLAFAVVSAIDNRQQACARAGREEWEGEFGGNYT